MDNLEAFKQQLVDLTAKFEHELKMTHVGRANPLLLDKVTVEIDGGTFPLKNLATILVAESNTLSVTPFDVNNIGLIRDAIYKNEQLNLNPTDNGRVIYLTIPPLTTETRQLIIKELNSRKEDFLIKARQLRHSALKSSTNDDVSNQLSKDESLKLNQQIQVVIDEFKLNIETKIKHKIAEIMQMKL